jgi:hypothetical protein
LRGCLISLEVIEHPSAF